MRRLHSNTSDRTQPRLSIRARLMVLALLAIVPLMLDRVRVLETTRQDRIDSAYAEVTSLASRAAEQQSETISLTKSLLQTVARSYTALERREDNCNGLLEKIAADVPWFRGITVVKGSGQAVCASRPVALNLDFADREYIQRARGMRDFVVSGYLVNRADKVPSIVAALPARREARSGEEDPVIVASLDLKWIGRPDRLVGQRRGAVGYLVDHDGNVLVSTRPGALDVDTAHQDLVKVITGSERGTIATAALDGRRRIFAFEQLPLTDAFILIGVNEQDVLSAIDGEITVAYMQLGMYIVIALLLVWLGGEHLIVQPIRALARTAADIGRGNLTARTTPDQCAAEFAPLATALADMALKLSVREHELRAANLRLGELALIDQLSGLANRRAFDARMREEWRQGLDSRRPLALLMIDADHFKLFNDSYGHLEGDRCLRTLAGVLKTVAAETGGFAARYGGEEFVLLIPGVEWDRAMQLAESLRSQVADLRIAHAQAPTRCVTISVGVASMLPHGGVPVESLVEAADAGLYAAKRRGRNAIASAPALALPKAG